MITRSARFAIQRSTPWMYDCGCLSTQPWWRPYSVAWIVTTSGARKRFARWSPADGDEPVVPVDDVEVVAVPHLDARGEHVRVHVLDPGDELAEVARALRLAHAVDEHAALHLLRRVLLAAAREHVHVDALGGQVLGQLAHVPGEAALDQRRVLPGQDQGAHSGLRGRERGEVEMRRQTAQRRVRSGRGVCQSGQRGVQGVRCVRRMRSAG